jgi:pSer/pThr/pTyr-binding forkhead associated (FHA) protein
MTDRPRSPYKGLVPYSEEDAPFFFGREEEREIICANLKAWQLTVFCGASGVGKSSVLRAGVAHDFHELAKQNIAKYGKAKFIVVIFPPFHPEQCRNTWQDDPVIGLQEEINRTVTKLFNETGLGSGMPSHSLQQTISAWSMRLDAKLLIILDQFEEYFQYHADEKGDQSFLIQFADAVNSPDSRANFLISIREDALSKLDLLKGPIPNIYDNYLRIEHLEREAARAAIVGPIRQYNSLDTQNGQQIIIKEDLVEEVLNQLQALALAEDDLPIVGKQGVSADNESVGDTRIQTPYLQLVMMRLWDEEMQDHSSILRLATFTNRLQGAEKIVSTHLIKAMNILSPAEQEAAADIFKYLVTPSGTKIAQMVTDLAKYASLAENQVAAVLAKLSGADIRILCPVAPPLGRPSMVRYEIYHDALAKPILNYLQNIEKVREKRHRFYRLLRWQGAVIGALVFFLLARQTYSLWVEHRPWGYVRDLSNGTVNQLTGNVAGVGRNVGSLDWANSVGLHSQYVSRLHLFISRRLSALDVRSRNGTTVNAEFLPYGESKTLNNGDIIVLAGTVPLKFESITYSLEHLYQVPPIKSLPIPPAWGLLIDGRTKAVNYLSADQYFVSIEQNRIVPKEQETDDYALRIRRCKDLTYSIEDKDDEITLSGIMKVNDYDFQNITFPADKLIPDCDAGGYDLSSATLSYEGIPFQIVSIKQDK